MAEEAREAVKIRVFVEDSEGRQFMAKIDPRIEPLILGLISGPSGAINGHPCSLTINTSIDLRNQEDEKP